MIPCFSSWTFHLGISFTLVAAFAVTISSSQYAPVPSPSYPTGYQQPNIYTNTRTVPTGYQQPIYPNTGTVPIGYTQHQVVQQPGVGTDVIDRTVSNQNYVDTRTGHVINQRTKQQLATHYDAYGQQSQVQKVTGESTDLQTGSRVRTSITTVNGGNTNPYYPGTVIQKQTVVQQGVPVVSNGYQYPPSYQPPMVG